MAGLFEEFRHLFLEEFRHLLTDEGVPPPERSEREELEEQAREDEGLGIGGFSAHYGDQDSDDDETEYVGLDD